MFTETGVGAWLLSKIVPTLAALFGGLTMVLLHTPNRLLEKGKVTAIFLAGGISATAGFSLTGVVAHYLGVGTHLVEMVLGLGWIIGFLSIPIFGVVANFFNKRQNQDIVDIYKEVKNLKD